MMMASGLFWECETTELVPRVSFADADGWEEAGRGQQRLERASDTQTHEQRRLTQKELGGMQTVGQINWYQNEQTNN